MVYCWLLPRIVKQWYLLLPWIVKHWYLLLLVYAIFFKVQSYITLQTYMLLTCYILFTGMFWDCWSTSIFDIYRCPLSHPLIRQNTIFWGEVTSKTIDSSLNRILKRGNHHLFWKLDLYSNIPSMPYMAKIFRDKIVLTFS